MGEDNLSSLHKWKNYELLLEKRTLLVYPRPNCKVNKFHSHKNVQILDAPQIEISSSFIRDAIKEGKDIRFFVPEGAWKYMDEMNFYR